jgi:2-polyprenyl-3-methyl-5-hydroxy-6-metoxy-1,4-benzoquinol methylase
MPAMGFLTDVRQRHREPEIMDDPQLDEARHHDALRGLERINRWSGSARILWPPICALARVIAPQAVRVLDLATGGGDVPCALWKKAQRAGLNVHVAGCDLSDRAVAYALERARRLGASAHFFQLDALNGEIPGDYDVLTTSLFLHHLQEDQAISLLRRMAEAARRLVLVNDLRRSFPGYLFAYVGTRLLSRSHVVHVDGPLSVRAAFTMAEARQLAERAGLAGAKVSWRVPFRFLLFWRKP